MKADSVIKCPSCNENTHVVQATQNVQNFGEVLITAIKCDKCGYRFTDVMSTEFNDAVEFKALIEKEDDLSIKVIKSSSGTIEIPEMGIEIEPGPASDGYITNVEGLIVRIEEAFSVIINSSKGKQKEKAEKKLNELIEAKNGRKKFTLIIKDPYGNSALVGRNAEKRMLSEAEAKKLIGGIAVIEKNP